MSENFNSLLANCKFLLQKADLGSTLQKAERLSMPKRKRKRKNSSEERGGGERTDDRGQLGTGWKLKFLVCP